jgi:hypothetical protein
MTPIHSSYIGFNKSYFRNCARFSTKALVHRLASTIFFLFALHSCLFAATYYVAKSGNDSNTGSQTAPWLTVQKAAKTMVAGDTCIIGTGTYNEKVTQSTNGTSGAHITYKASGSVTLGGFYISGDYIDGNGFTFNAFGVGINEAVIYTTAASNNASFSNCSFTGTHSIDSGVGGIQAWGTNGTFSNITITDPGSHSVALIGDGNSVSKCNITDSNGWDIFRVVGSNENISGCTISASNPLANPNHCDIIQSFNDYGDNISQNVIFENNKVIQAPDYQLGNITDDLGNNPSGGAISKWTFRNNLFIDISNCMNLFAPGFSFYNNTFVRVGINSGFAIIYGNSRAGQANNLTIINNIFYQSGDPTRANRGWYAGDPVTSLVADYNLVIGTGDGQTKLGFQTAGLEAHGINGQDPRFVDATIMNFQLQATSPVIGAGQMLNSLFNTDLTGNPRGTVWDIGAFQHDSGLVPPNSLKIVP